MFSSDSASTDRSILLYVDRKVIIIRCTVILFKQGNQKDGVFKVAIVFEKLLIWFNIPDCIGVPSLHISQAIRASRMVHIFSIVLNEAEFPCRCKWYNHE